MSGVLVSELENFAGGPVELRHVRGILHQEFDLALDDLLMDVLHRPLDNAPIPIVIEVAPALLRHIQEKLP